MGPAALDGAALPGDKHIAKGVLRGVPSDGMLCSLGELGLTVNDYINQKRVDFMATELKKAPLSHKEIYFAAGYRSRQTAYRNFLKFKGVSPTEFVTAPESQS